MLTGDGVTTNDDVTNRRGSWVMASSQLIILPPLDVEHPSRWYYQVLDVKNTGNVFREASSDVTSMPNFIKIRQPFWGYMRTGNDDIMTPVSQTRSCLSVFAEDHG
jgi:hypothetical protein